MDHPAIASFWSSQYAPHGYCLLWRPDLIGIHLISDVLIALAYFSIPITLVRFVRKRDDMQFGGLFWLFAIFIMACGMTHVMGVWNLWNGDYGAEGVVKLVTAAASVPTAILLWRILPQALAIPSQQQLRQSNDHLTALIMERDLAVARLEQEIRERQQTEAALVQSQKVDAIGQLTGGIAHDFNNLLQAISGNLELIRNQVEAESPLARWSDNAMKAVNRGTRLSKQLLVFSRVQRLELAEVNVDRVIEGMRDLISKSIGPAIEVDLQLNGGNSLVMTDGNQLEMSLLNLAINARDAMPEGGLLKISTDHIAPEAGALGPGVAECVRIIVEDHGSGMSPEVLAKALDPFYTTKEVGKGTGLGLSMAFGFARQSGGTLTIDSVEGRGTTITMLLPTVEASGAQAASDRPAPNPQLFKRKSKRGTAILVDDDEDVRPVVEEMLRDLGFTVRSYPHPNAFLDTFDGKEADLVILDFIMPGINGAALAKRIREQAPGQRILFISGYSESASIDEVQGPSTRMLRKPFDLEELGRQVDDLLGANAATGRPPPDEDGTIN